MDDMGMLSMELTDVEIHVMVDAEEGREGEMLTPETVGGVGTNK